MHDVRRMSTTITLPQRLTSGGKIPEQKNFIDVIIGSSLISVLFPRVR
jgi:hypothetical protein